MSKLSSEKIKELMAGWLSQSAIREDLRCHSEPEGSTIESQEFLDRAAGWYGFKKGCTQEELESHIWSMWCDVKRWKRHSKRKLKEDWDQYIFNHYETNLPAFNVDFAGASDEELVARYSQDGSRCIMRCFIPDNDLADNYRLEVVTTPEDDAVVGWTIVVD